MAILPAVGSSLSSDMKMGPPPPSQSSKDLLAIQTGSSLVRRGLPSTKASSEWTSTGEAVPQLQIRELHLGMFEIGKPLGKGKFGRVYLVRHRPSGYICALKTLDKAEIIREGAEKHVRREIEVHSNLRHPGILTFHSWFHDSRRIFLLLEYAAGGELFKVLQRETRFPEPRAASYAAQVAKALCYLHSKNVMHRDIKPENILVGLYGELKLADFGYSVYAPSDLRKTMCGTLDYLPPEMITSKSGAGYTKAIDQWTLGVLTYELLTGHAPFEDTMVMTQRRIRNCDMTPLPATVSPEAKEFISKLLCLDPSKRLSLDMVSKHPWIAQYSS